VDPDFGRVVLWVCFTVPGSSRGVLTEAIQSIGLPLFLLTDRRGNWRMAKDPKLQQPAADPAEVVSRRHSDRGYAHIPSHTR
jgi:hypothetical protein